jgi:hypothetical protein
MPTKTERQITEIEKYEGPVKIYNVDTMEALGYTFLWGYADTLSELTESHTYKDFTRDGTDFVIAVDRKGYSICRKADRLEEIYDIPARYKSERETTGRA